MQCLGCEGALGWCSYQLCICLQVKAGICAVLIADAVATRAGVNSKRTGIDQFNPNSIPELERKLELKDLEQNELNLN